MPVIKLTGRLVVLEDDIFRGKYSTHYMIGEISSAGLLC